MAKVQLNLSTEGTVRALESGELPWTLHPACEFASDPGQWGASLLNNAEVMTDCLDAAGVRSVVAGKMRVLQGPGDANQLLAGFGSRMPTNGLVMSLEVIWLC